MLRRTNSTATLSDWKTNPPEPPRRPMSEAFDAARRQLSSPPRSQSAHPTTEINRKFYGMMPRTQSTRAVHIIDRPRAAKPECVARHETPVVVQPKPRRAAPPSILDDSPLDMARLTRDVDALLSGYESDTEG